MVTETQHQIFVLSVVAFACVLVILGSPVVVNFVGFAVALTICYHAVIDQLVFWWAIRTIDKEHEQL